MGWEEDQGRRSRTIRTHVSESVGELASGWARTIRTHVLKSVGEAVSQVGGCADDSDASLVLGST